MTGSPEERRETVFFRIYLFIFFIAFIAFFLYREVYVFSRKTGVHPFSILRSRALNKAAVLETLIGLEYAALVIVVIGYIFNLGFMEQIGSVPVLERAWIKWLGVLDSWVFLLFMFPAIHRMGKDFRVGIDEEFTPDLHTDGVFVLTRNPIFFGILHMFLSVFLIVPNCLSLFLVFAYYLTVTELIKEEERLLEPLLGEPYRRYLESVPRFCPRPWPAKKTRGRNREHD